MAAQEGERKIKTDLRKKGEREDEKVARSGVQEGVGGGEKGNSAIGEKKSRKEADRRSKRVRRKGKGMAD